MNLALIGYRGVGKSVIGQLIARRTGLEYASTDALSAEQLGCPLQEFIAHADWERFRDIESSVLAGLCHRDGLLVDCGGGIVERQINIDLLKRSARVLWLRAEAETLIQRLQHSSPRLPLDRKASDAITELREQLARRWPLYKMAAEYLIQTDALTPGQVADLAVHWWGHLA